MSRSAGTGIPLTWKCHRCRGHGGRCGKPVVTGRFEKRSDFRFIRRGRFYVEYTCQECGFTGWTNHVDAEDMLILKKLVGEYRP